MSNLSQRNEEAVEMLKEKGIKKYAEVLTEDEVSLGKALRLHYRNHDINPDMRLYASYIETTSIPMGGSVFIPTDFIEDFQPDDNKVMLSVKFSTVKHETWDRTPGFVAHQTGEVEELSD